MNKLAAPLRYMLTFCVGAAAAYMLDPDRGRRRRSIVRDRTAAVARRAGAVSGKRARYVAGRVNGALRQVTRGGRADGRVLYDAALADRVRSEVWRELPQPRNRVTLEAIGNVVVLRGEMADPQQIRQFEARVLQVPGVGGVENLLRLSNK